MTTYVRDLSGNGSLIAVNDPNTVAAQPAFLVDGPTGLPTKAVQSSDVYGNVIGQNLVYLTSMATVLPATTGSALVWIPQGRNYIWDAQFTGTSLELHALGSDGVTWRTVATLSASGTYSGQIYLGAGTVVRVYNPNATILSSLSTYLD